MDRREEGFLMFALFVFSLFLVFYVFSFLSIGPFPDRVLVRDDGAELFPVSKKRPFPPKITPLTFMFTGTEMSGCYVVSAGFLRPEAFPKVLPGDVRPKDICFVPRAAGLSNLVFAGECLGTI